MTGTHTDIVIIGAGHNGLVAAAYLARAGYSVLLLERNSEIGGATRSKRVFEGFDARLSVYSYLVSLFPQKITDELGLKLDLRSRRTASYTPTRDADGFRELLLRNGDDHAPAFHALTGNDHDYRGCLELQAMQQQIADVVWPSLTRPLVARQTLRDRLDREGQAAWEALMEQPLGQAIESRIDDDLVRGLVFTDAKIGVSTHPHDPSLLQNRCFLYHVIGRGTGEWRVPVGGMGALVDELDRVIRATGKVRTLTDARVQQVQQGSDGCSVVFEHQDARHEVDARFVLCNASAEVLGQLTGEADEPPSLDGSGFKINLLLERLPRLRSRACSPEDAFAGTFHIDEGYAHMEDSYRQSMAGQLPERPPGEIYCHTLTDDSILSPELRQRGFHTLTLFGLDLPYALFEQDNEGMRKKVVARYLAGINRCLDEPIESCLAYDAEGAPCIEAMSAVDLEQSIHLPRGNIFHGDLSWPFTDDPDEVGTWGVETTYPNVLRCGSAAKRGGAVSGIPGHNAAMKVLEHFGH